MSKFYGGLVASILSLSVGLFFVVLAFILILVSMSIVGLVVTFTTSVILGFIFIILPIPICSITGILYVVAGYNLPAVLKNLLQLPF